MWIIKPDVDFDLVKWDMRIKKKMIECFFYFRIVRHFTCFWRVEICTFGTHKLSSSCRYSRVPGNLAFSAQTELDLTTALLSPTLPFFPLIIKKEIVKTLHPLMQ